MQKWLFALLAVFSVSLADKYHPDTHEGVQENFREARLHPDESAASFWRLSAQMNLIKKVQKSAEITVPKNIIFFIGDGMDISTVATTRKFLGSEEESLFFETFPHFGLAKTYCTNRKVPDSACTATAYLSGVKNNYGVIGLNGKVERKSCEGMENSENHVESIAKWAQNAGKATGVVTTTRITHASPAGNYAHIGDRDWEAAIPCANSKYGDIAHQLIHGDTGKNFQVIFGCGTRMFLNSTEVDIDGQSGSRTDGRNLIEEWKKANSENGQSFQFASTK